MLFVQAFFDVLFYRHCSPFEHMLFYIFRYYPATGSDYGYITTKTKVCLKTR